MLGLCCSSNFSLVWASGGYSLGGVCGCLIAAASLLSSSMGSRAWGVQQLQLLACRAHSVGGHMGLVAPQNVGSPRIKDRTLISCTGRWVLYRWATREAQVRYFKHHIKLWFYKTFWALWYQVCKVLAFIYHLLILLFMFLYACSWEIMGGKSELGKKNLFSLLKFIVVFFFPLTIFYFLFFKIYFF